MNGAANSFRLSRIHAEGWNAARQTWLPGAGEPVNPWPAEPERSRWQQGFASAQIDVKRKSS